MARQYRSSVTPSINRLKYYSFLNYGVIELRKNIFCEAKTFERIQ